MLNAARCLGSYTKQYSLCGTWLYSSRNPRQSEECDSSVEWRPDSSQVELYTSKNYDFTANRTLPRFHSPVRVHDCNHSLFIYNYQIGQYCDYVYGLMTGLVNLLSLGLMIALIFILGWSKYLISIRTILWDELNWMLLWWSSCWLTDVSLWSNFVELLITYQSEKPGGHKFSPYSHVPHRDLFSAQMVTRYTWDMAKESKLPPQHEYLCRWRRFGINLFSDSDKYFILHDQLFSPWYRWHQSFNCYADHRHGIIMGCWN